MTVKDDVLNITLPQKSPFKDFYKNALNNIPEGILFINENCTQAEANDTFKKIHGWEENKPIVISSLLELLSVFDLNHNILDFSKWPISKLINREEFHDEKFILQINETGKIFYASYSGYPQYDGAGNYAGGIIILKDMTELINTKTLLEEEIDKKNNFYREIKQYQKQLKADRELLQTIIDTIPVMITIYEKKFESVILNKAFVQITGWTNEDVKKTNIMELAYPDPHYRAEVYEYVQSLETGFRDMPFRTKDGRDIQTSWANVEIPDGRQVGVGLDISQRKQMENELITARENAEKAAKVQMAFIQSISHEVRTPMNSIIGYTELLHKRLKEKKDVEFLYAISYNGLQLLRLIDDIIDVSRLDNKDLAIHKSEISLVKLMENTKRQVPGLKKKYNKKHIKVLFTLSNKLKSDIQIYSDEIRVQQILTNLVSNAIQFSEKGTVEVSYELRKEWNDILFIVKDTGIGINKEDYPKVFHRFKRLHDTVKTEVRGTGLGLPICKHLVELLGGKIWFESEPGKGTIFYFTHPIEKQAVITKTDRVRKENFTLPKLQNYTILIAEDDLFSYTMMYHMLSETEATILHADTGIKATEIFDQYHVDFVFLDIRLPGMDGYKVLNHIRTINNNIPVVAQTANALPEDREKIRSAGFNAYITKPVFQNDLYAVINKHLKFI